MLYAIDRTAYSTPSCSQSCLPCPHHHAPSRVYLEYSCYLFRSSNTKLPRLPMAIALKTHMFVDHLRQEIDSSVIYIFHVSVISSFNASICIDCYLSIPFIPYPSVQDSETLDSTSTPTWHERYTPPEGYARGTHNISWITDIACVV